ncbi:hypothetical protein NPIL_308931 [Nephila pilipes]|uniref:Uncharacterized protein n=1 Tax=Nephila pilipes TaxID=299642 RepID=A0A8X6PJF9_NEPPI|nr:hypothetical protein NPIL_308931 [Nephila pilipes]
MQSAALEQATLTDSSDINIYGDGTRKTHDNSSRGEICAVIGDKTGRMIDAEMLFYYKRCNSGNDKNDYLLISSGKDNSKRNVLQTIVAPHFIFF